jgi:Skp family chaperone for outer membrane proteins
MLMVLEPFGAPLLMENVMEHFDFDKMAALANDPVAFEAERERLIQAHLDSVPEEHVVKITKLQDELDAKRKSMTSERFLVHLGERMRENLENLSDQCQALQALMEVDQPEKPRLKAINKVAYTGQWFTDKR